MSKKATKPEPTDITPCCIYCKHNAGEDKIHGFMWHCKLLSYCVAFSYKRKFTEKDELTYCKAMFLGKGSFEVDKEKYKDYKINNK